MKLSPQTLEAVVQAASIEELRETVKRLYVEKIEAEEEAEYYRTHNAEAVELLIKQNALKRDVKDFVKRYKV